MERRFINVYNVCVGLRHYYSSYRGAKLLLLVAELLNPLILGLVDHLRLSIAGSMLKVDLSNEPLGQLCQAQLLSPVVHSLLQGHMPLSQEHCGEAIMALVASSSLTLEPCRHKRDTTL